MKGIAVEDYVADQEPELTDPTDPHEQVDRDFMDKLGEFITRVEEVVDAGNGDLRLADLSKFITARGNVLDMLDDPQLQAWLDHMRQTARVRYRRYTVG